MHQSNLKGLLPTYKCRMVWLSAAHVTPVH